MDGLWVCTTETRYEKREKSINRSVDMMQGSHMNNRQQPFWYCNQHQANHHRINGSRQIDSFQHLSRAMHKLWCSLTKLNMRGPIIAFTFWMLDVGARGHERPDVMIFSYCTQTWRWWWWWIISIRLFRCGGIVSSYGRNYASGLWYWPNAIADAASQSPPIRCPVTVHYSI